MWLLLLTFIVNWKLFHSLTTAFLCQVHLWLPGTLLPKSSLRASAEKKKEILVLQLKATTCPVNLLGQVRTSASSYCAQLYLLETGQELAMASWTRLLTTPR